MIIGHGIDIVDVARVAQIVERHGAHLTERVFTQAELDYARRGKRTMEHLAGRFAAKEAVLKALGTGWTKGIGWTDVEVVLEPSGRPTAALHGRAAEIASDLGITAWSLSLSHTDTSAVASAIATGDRPS
ncbi:MAG: holo-ACP synthase [Planctomycetota bacterium]